MWERWLQENCVSLPQNLLDRSISQVSNTVKSANTKKDQYPQVWRKNRQWHQEEVVLHDYCFDWQNCQLMPVYRVNLLILVHTHVQITMSFSETGLWERHYSGTVWSHWRKGEGGSALHPQDFLFGSAPVCRYLTYWLYSKDPFNRTTILSFSSTFSKCFAVDIIAHQMATKCDTQWAEAYTHKHIYVNRALIL